MYVNVLMHLIPTFNDFDNCFASHQCTLHMYMPIKTAEGYVAFGKNAAEHPYA